MEIGTPPYKSPDFDISPDQDHILLLKKEGYKDREITFKVERGEEKDLGSIQLEKVIVTGTILIKTEPVGSAVFFGSTELGTCPLEGLKHEDDPGEYVFRAEKEGYIPGSASGQVALGKETQLLLKLEPQPGKVKMTSDPLEARVFIDGEEVGLTPYQSSDFILAPDVDHTLLLKKKGYKSKEVRFTVEKGKELDLGAFILEKSEGYLTITTVPDGVRVYLPDNTMLGTTPFERKSLSVGTINLKLKKDGYEDRETPVGIQEDQDTNISETLIETKMARINKLLTKASQRMDAKKYTTPAGEDALSLYREILTFDSSNQAAIEGIETIYSYYFSRGNSFLVSANFTKARYYFNKCLEVKPNDAAIETKMGEVEQKEKDAKQAKEKQKRHEVARAPEPGEVKAIDLGEGVTLDLVWIPPGEFMMGSLASEEGRIYTEGPRHRVKITNGFWMGKYEVTQEQWEVIMGENPSLYKGNTNPVELVSWNDCQDFVNKLSLKLNIDFRLPSEAEWEYACRAGTDTAFHYGDNLSSTQANFNGNSPYGKAPKGPYLNKTTPVGSYSPNTWGLYDMHGNVPEWCQDLFAKYPKWLQIDPKGPSFGESRIMRGGACTNEAKHCRSAMRNNMQPTYGKGYLFGLRVVSSSGEKVDKYKLQREQNQREKAAQKKAKEDRKIRNLAAKRLVVGSFAGEETSVNLGDGMELKLVWIPPGTFTMGYDDGGSSYDSKTFIRHKVGITKGFWMGKYEVTISEYVSFINDLQKVGTNNLRWIEIEEKFSHIADSVGQFNIEPGYEKHPVVNVTWHGAVAFCDWLTDMIQKECRLPTEAEWEYACRAGSTTSFFFGKWNIGEGTIKRYCWYEKNAEEYSWTIPHAKTEGPQPVGTKLPNSVGLHDMLGNVDEWCSDWYSENYYKESPKNDPAGPSMGKGRVYRGGGYWSQSHNMYSGDRSNCAPNKAYYARGFRIVIPVAE